MRPHGFAHRVVANCRAAAERLRFEGVPARKISVIANGLDVDAYAPRRPITVVRRVATVANLRREKGHDVLLDTVGVGDCLGEVAIFNPDKASATVKSLQNGRLWTIDAAALQDFLYEWPAYGCAALLGIDIILSRRLKRTNSVISYHEIVPGFLSVRSKKRAATASLR